MAGLAADKRSPAVEILDKEGGRHRWFKLAEVVRLSRRPYSTVTDQLNRGVRLGHVQEHEGRFRIPVEGVDGTTLPGYIVTEAGLAEPVTPPPVVKVSERRGPTASPIVAALQELSGSEARWVPYGELLGKFGRSVKNTRGQLARSIRLGHIEESEGRYRIAGRVEA